MKNESDFKIKSEKIAAIITAIRYIHALAADDSDAEEVAEEAS